MHSGMNSDYGSSSYWVSIFGHICALSYGADYHWHLQDSGGALHMEYSLPFVEKLLLQFHYKVGR